jgi:uncharacterized protein (TIGR02118 family)
MIKAIFVLSRHPDLSLAECHQHWFEVHGAHHVSSTHKLLGYSQHHTLVAAYAHDPAPTHDGASIIWVEDFPTLTAAIATPAWQAAVVDGVSGVYGGRQLYAEEMPIAVAEEKVVVDGPTHKLMLKAIWTGRRHPDMTIEAFRDHWLHIHGPLAARVPGVRRYVQNHPILEAGAYEAATHDGWAEVWFDDLDAVRTAMASEEWERVQADGASLFDPASMCFVLGRERPMMTPRY